MNYYIGRHIILVSTVLMMMPLLQKSPADCAVPKKNIIRVYYLEKTRLPDLILVYGDWNELSKQGFGVEYMRRLRRTWALGFGFERIHNSLTVNDGYDWSDIRVGQDLDYALDKFGVNLEWQIRRKYYGFIIGGGFAIAHLKTRAANQYEYFDPDYLLIREREEGRTINLAMDDRIGVEVFLPSRLKVSSVFLEASFVINMKNLKNEVRWTNLNRPDEHSTIDVDYLNNFSDGIFLRAGIKFLF